MEHTPTKSTQVVDKLTNSRFGYLTALRPTKKDKDRHVYWLCRCDCGTEKQVAQSDLLRGRTSSCGCSRIGQKSKRWKGEGELSAVHWGNIRRRAKKRGLPLEITIKDGWELFLNQRRLCALSRLPLKFSRTKIDYDGNASLDRIDNTQGYIKGNVQWVHKDINMMKHTHSQEHFLHLCKQVATNS